MTLAEQLAAIGGFDQREIMWIERELAYAQMTLNKRGAINWTRHFPWLKPRMSELQDNLCCWCHRPMIEGHSQRRPTFEHIIPLSLGGEDEPSNMAITCYECNQDRGRQYQPAAVRFRLRKTSPVTPTYPMEIHTRELQS